MTVYRITQFKVGADHAAEMGERRAALIAAVRGRFPGLSEARLARIDEESWVDMWRWDSLAEAQAALAAVASIPEAGAVFSLTREPAAYFAEAVDVR